MKTVFTNDMVAHVWAQQTQQEGRTANRNFWFSGATLYSYRTPIAVITRDNAGNKVCLFTSKSYSVTTNGNHIGPARRALRGLMAVYVVPHLGITGGWDRGFRDGLDHHVANLADFAANYEAAKDTLKRKRDLYETPSATLAHIANAARDYAVAFGRNCPPMPFEVDAQLIETFRADREARNNTPAKLAAKERAKERKAAKVRDQYRAGESIRSITGNYGYRAERRLHALMTDADHAARAEALRIINADKIGAWLAGAPVSIRFDAEAGGAALRIRGDNLETSHGASVPLAHAIKAFRFLKLCKERGQGWHHNGHSLRVGHFTVDSIAPNGDFKAGCHDIRWAEVERVARAHGLFDQQASDEALTPTASAA